MGQSAFIPSSCVNKREANSLPNISYTFQCPFSITNRHWHHWILIVYRVHSENFWLKQNSEGKVLICEQAAKYLRTSSRSSACLWTLNCASHNLMLSFLDAFSSFFPEIYFYPFLYNVAPLWDNCWVCIWTLLSIKILSNLKYSNRAVLVCGSYFQWTGEKW